MGFSLDFVKFFDHRIHESRLELTYQSFLMQNMSIHMLVDDTQRKNFIIFYVMKIMIHLAWVGNSLVIFSASY